MTSLAINDMEFILQCHDNGTSLSLSLKYTRIGVGRWAARTRFHHCRLNLPLPDIRTQNTRNSFKNSLSAFSESTLKSSANLFFLTIKMKLMKWKCCDMDVMDVLVHTIVEIRETGESCEISGFLHLYMTPWRYRWRDVNI